MPYVQAVRRATTRYRVKWSEDGVRKSRNFSDRAEAEAFSASLPAVVRKGGPGGPGPKRQPISDRIGRLTSVNAAGCWIWKGQINKQGYGQLMVAGRMSLAHRVSYLELVGPIPEGLVLDHLCRVRHCVSPLHLEPVTQRENVMRSPIALGAINARKTHCPSGHPYSPENTRVYRQPNFTGRLCITCQRASARRSQAKRRAARAEVSA